MFFYLTTLSLARFLTEDPPTPKIDEPNVASSSEDANVCPKTDVQAASAIDAWNHSDFLCRNYVLNGLTDSLYNVYSEKKTAKELWQSLERKYKTEDAGAKKFMVGRFLDYKMVDSRAVIKQVQEIQVILHKIHAEGMNLGETFQVAAIIEKLPPSWNDFKNYLKHKRNKMNVEELVIRLRIEEENKSASKNYFSQHVTKAKVVEHGKDK